MGAPDCNQHAGAIRTVESLLASAQAISDVREYLVSYRGASFDTTADSEAVDEFTAGDFEAVGYLSVSVLHTARAWLTGDGHDQVAGLLAVIPAGTDIWEIAPDEYEATLGPDSPAWRLWELLAEHLEGARSAGRWVTASKLLAAKRPRLVPIFDQAEIRKKLGIEHHDIWEVMWCVLQNPDSRQRLLDIRSQVKGAAELSLLRVLDIVLWMARPARVGRPEVAPEHLESVRLAATRFRAALEEGGLRLRSLAKFPKGSCGDASEMLGEYLSDSGLGSWIFRSGVEDDSWDSHAWVEQEGVIVDITPDQFPEISERVLVTTDRTWHDDRFPTSLGAKSASMEWFERHDHQADALADYAALKSRADSVR